MKKEEYGKLYSNEECTVIGIKKNIICFVFTNKDDIVFIDLDTLEDFRFFRHICKNLNIDPIERATICYKSCYAFD